MPVAIAKAFARCFLQWSGEELLQTRISSIIHGRRRVTADTALRLGKYFGTSARFWLGIQDDYDLEDGEIQIEDELTRIPTLAS